MEDQRKTEMLKNWQSKIDKSITAVAREVAKSVLASGRGISDEFINWMITGLTAISAVMIANVDKLIHISNNIGLLISGALMFLSVLFAVAAKFYSTKISAFLQMLDLLDASSKSISESHMPDLRAARELLLKEEIVTPSIDSKQELFEKLSSLLRPFEKNRLKRNYEAIEKLTLDQSEFVATFRNPARWSMNRGYATYASAIFALLAFLLLCISIGMQVAHPKKPDASGSTQASASREASLAGSVGEKPVPTTTAPATNRSAQSPKR